MKLIIFYLQASPSATSESFGRLWWIPLAAAILGSLLTLTLQSVRDAFRRRNLRKKINGSSIDNEGTVEIANWGRSSLMNAQPAICIPVDGDLLPKGDERWSVKPTRKQLSISQFGVGNRDSLKDARLVWARVLGGKNHTAVTLHSGETDFVAVCKPVILYCLANNGADSYCCWGLEFASEEGYSSSREYEDTRQRSRMFIVGMNVKDSKLCIEGELRMFADNITGITWPLRIEWDPYRPRTVDLTLGKGTRIKPPNIWSRLKESFPRFSNRGIRT